MNEVQAILAVYEQVKRSGEPAALATVVNVSGSTYRRPGAHALIRGSGQMVGMISGGCLENDVAEHATQVMQSGEPRVVTYDTTADEDIVWGLGLGCNGVVQILIEPLDTDWQFNPLALLAQVIGQQGHCVLATVFSVKGSTTVKIRSRLIYHSDGTVTHNMADPKLVLALLPDVQSVVSQQYAVKAYNWTSGSVEVMLEWIHPPTSLLLFGAGQDAVPVAQLAKALGWQVTIADCRSSEATQTRFPMADTVILTRRETVHQQIQVDASTVAVVMTHSYLDDAELLKMLLLSPARYIGILGPKHRTERLLQTLQQEGAVNVDQARERIHAPVGLDIGADTPEAIALSIIAEVQAVLANRSGGCLRNRQGSIHPQNKNLPREGLLCLPSVL